MCHSYHIHFNKALDFIDICDPRAIVKLLKFVNIKSKCRTCRGARMTTPTHHCHSFKHNISPACHRRGRWYTELWKWDWVMICRFLIDLTVVFYFGKFGRRTFLTFKVDMAKPVLLFFLKFSQKMSSKLTHSPCTLS